MNKSDYSHDIQFISMICNTYNTFSILYNIIGINKNVLKFYLLFNLKKRE